MSPNLNCLWCFTLLSSGGFIVQGYHISQFCVCHWGTVVLLSKYLTQFRVQMFGIDLQKHLSRHLGRCSPWEVWGHISGIAAVLHLSTLVCLLFWRKCPPFKKVPVKWSLWGFLTSLEMEVAQRQPSQRVPSLTQSCTLRQEQPLSLK